MTGLDPRLARRRRAVAEHQARRRVRRLVTLLMVVVLVAAMGWLLQSPLLSVHRITVEGANRAPVRQLLRRNGAGPLTPLVMIRPTRVEQALEADPWVGAAHVTVRFPDTVEVTVRERTPVGWARHEGNWLLVAADGVPVESVPSPRAGATGLIDLPLGEFELGRRHPDPRVRAAAGFLAAVPVRVRGSVTVRLHHEEVWARFGGYNVRLGSPTDMRAKAAALAAVLTDGVPPGSTITLISASHPAVRLPEQATAGD